MSLVTTISHKNWIARTFELISILNASKLFIDFFILKQTIFQEILKDIHFSYFYFLSHAFSCKGMMIFVTYRIIIITRFGELLNTWRNVLLFNICAHQLFTLNNIDTHMYVLTYVWRWLYVCIYACILRNG